MFSIDKSESHELCMKYGTIMENKNHGYLEIIDKDSYDNSFISYIDFLFDRPKIKKLKIIIKRVIQFN